MAGRERDSVEIPCEISEATDAWYGVLARALSQGRTNTFSLIAKVEKGKIQSVRLATNEEFKQGGQR